MRQLPKITIELNHSGSASLFLDHKEPSLSEGILLLLISHIEGTWLGQIADESTRLSIEHSVNRVLQEWWAEGRVYYSLADKMWMECPLYASGQIHSKKRHDIVPGYDFNFLAKAIDSPEEEEYKRKPLMNWRKNNND